MLDHEDWNLKLRNGVRCFGVGGGGSFVSLLGYLYWRSSKTQSADPSQGCYSPFFFFSPSHCRELQVSYQYQCSSGSEVSRLKKLRMVMIEESGQQSCAGRVHGLSWGRSASVSILSSDLCKLFEVSRASPFCEQETHDFPVFILAGSWKIYEYV